MYGRRDLNGNWARIDYNCPVNSGFLSFCGSVQSVIMSLPIRVAVTVSLLCACTATAFGQGVQAGILRGTVRDQQGLPIPGVTIAVTSPALQGLREATTGTDGGYVFRLLPAGEYAIAFNISGFVPVNSTSPPN